MMERSGGTEPEPTGWALVRLTVRALWRDVRYPTPIAVRYLRCDACGQVTPHTRDRGMISISARDVIASPPEAVCDECGHIQPRMLGDEVPAEVTVPCAGRRYRRIRADRSRRACGREFAVPAAASSVLCPWCATRQANPATALWLWSDTVWNRPSTGSRYAGRWVNDIPESARVGR